MPGSHLTPLPLTAARLADAVFDRIGTAIVDGTLAAGDRIRDAEIADQLGVSRMPVREALQRLERLGLVEMAPSRFTRVTEVTPELARASFEHFGYQVSLAARMSVPRMDEAARRKTLGMIDELVTLIDDPEPFYEAAGRFFHHLAEHTRNPVFLTAIREGWLALRRNLRGPHPMWGTDAEIVQHFAELREAVRAGDGDAAGRTMRRRHSLGE
ncbi:GntR family transcriptional regulator [Microbacterium sediminis]|uniref:HTH gntR-type domain-containing protein n=1 Tax=Microbacterium sediminis TaxID=904291 RepID=A0A1B9ND94_9MICO|nr:GntR family transcriptional regulator [Microbacterium sediminis]OCG74571.1 hypothetical protein A7J15_03260 [Microbacterium sediminis]